MEYQIKTIVSFNWRNARATTVTHGRERDDIGFCNCVEHILDNVDRPYSTIIKSIGEETYVRIQLFDD